MEVDETEGEAVEMAVVAAIGADDAVDVIIRYFLIRKRKAETDVKLAESGFSRDRFDEHGNLR
eukprot:3266151-Prymnesium_polylepis.1